MKPTLAVATCLVSFFVPVLAVQILADELTRSENLPPGTQATGVAALYLVFEVDALGSIEPVFSRQVRLSTSPQTRTDEELAAARDTSFEPERSSLTIQLEAAGGQVVYQDVVEVPRWIRGEFRGRPRAGGGLEIEGYRVIAPRRAFVLRVPAFMMGRASLSRAITRSTFDLDRLVERYRKSCRWQRMADSGRARWRRWPSPADPGNRVDILTYGGWLHRRGRSPVQ